MKTPFLNVSAFGAASVLAVSFTAEADAATLSIARLDGTQTDNLTTLGTSDWNIWDDYDASDDVNGEGTPGNNTRDGNWSDDPLVYNEKSGGSGIGPLTATLAANSGQNVAQDGFFATDHNFSYSDGLVGSPAGTASESGLKAGLAIVGTLAEISGSSFSLNVTTASTLQHTLYLYGSTRRADTLLTIGLPGASPMTDAFDTGADTGTTFQFRYTILFTPDNVGDQLSVNFAVGANSSQDTSPFNNIRIGGAALSVIPEPSTALFGISTLSLLALRRRR